MNAHTALRKEVEAYEELVEDIHAKIDRLRSKLTIEEPCAGEFRIILPDGTLIVSFYNSFSEDYGLWDSTHSRWLQEEGFPDADHAADWLAEREAGI